MKTGLGKIVSAVNSVLWKKISQSVTKVKRGRCKREQEIFLFCVN